MTIVRANGNEAPSHIASFDALRGFAIVFVVYLHAYFSPWEVTPGRDKLNMHLVHLFAHTAVPMFLFISGYLLAVDRSRSFKVFVSRKVMRIGVPMLFWMTAALAYRMWDEGGWTGWMHWKDFLLFNISGQFYYLFVLIVFYVGFFPVRHWDGRRLARLAALAFAANLVTIAWYESSSISGDFATLAYRNPLTWVFFVAFGMAAARRKAGPEWSRRAVALAAAAMGALFAVYLHQGEGRSDYPVSYFGVVVFLFSCVALVVYPSALAWVFRQSRGAKALAPATWLGRFAFGIYLVHMPFFIGFVTEQVVSGSALNDDYAQLMNGIFAVGFGSSLAFVVVVSLLFPRVAALLLGVEARAPRAAGTVEPARGYVAP
ncbi:MAG: acyltransferase [Dehalococcoidia bacterium]